MKRKHRLQQPRSVLESRILKQINDLSYRELVEKYCFLSRKYELI